MSVKSWLERDGPLKLRVREKFDTGMLYQGKGGVWDTHWDGAPMALGQVVVITLLDLSGTEQEQ